MAQCKSPCKNCGDRFVGCHSTCERYQQFFVLNEQRKAENDRNREVDNVLRGYNKGKTYATRIDAYGKRRLVNNISH